MQPTYVVASLFSVVLSGDHLWEIGGKTIVYSLAEFGPSLSVNAERSHVILEDVASAL